MRKQALPRLGGENEAEPEYEPPVPQLPLLLELVEAEAPDGFERFDMWFRLTTQVGRGLRAEGCCFRFELGSKSRASDANT